MKSREIDEPPAPVISFLPRSTATIRRLFGEDEQFRELCGDYAECLVMLARLRREQGGSDERLEQYCELRVNLERELLSQISRPGIPLKAPASGDPKEEMAPKP